jgi:hypothetical protein
LKKIACLITLLLSSCVSFAQIIFEKGYFVDNGLHRTECLIKNQDWKNNPKDFEYKSKESDASRRANLLTVKEFGVYGISKFVRADVKMDRSPAELDRLSDNSEPLWSQEQLYLKVLVSGKATLYYYEEQSLKRFFYSVSDSLITQLIYKEYLIESQYVGANNRFRDQLWKYVRIPNSTRNPLDGVNYNQKGMLWYFKKYNDLSGGTALAVDSLGIQARDIFHLWITPGINCSSLSLTNNYYTDRNADFSTGIFPRIGLEAEFVLPFNKNKWSVITEPSYQFYVGGTRFKAGKAKVSFHLFQLPVGIRYSFFLNENLKVFVNGYVVSSLGAKLNSSVIFDDPFASPLILKPQNCVAIGCGIGLKRVNAEACFYTNQDLLNDYIYWKSAYRQFLVIVSYRMF